MFLVAGLGNPGEEYAATPHNLGFMVVDRLAARHSIRISRKECQALVGLGADAAESIIAEGVEKSMTRFNGRAQGSTEER